MDISNFKKKLLLKKLISPSLDEKRIIQEDAQLRKKHVDTTMKIDSNHIFSDQEIIDNNNFINIVRQGRFKHFPNHKHSFLEIQYVIQGCSRQKINNKPILLEQGDLLVLNQNIFHETSPAKHEDYILNFHINPKLFYTIIKFIQHDKNIYNFLINIIFNSHSSCGIIFKNTHSNIKIENIIFSIVEEYYNDNSILKIKLYMALLLLELMNLPIKVIGGKDIYSNQSSTIISVLNYIDNNYKNGSLKEISKNLNLKNYHISKMLKEKLGKNFTSILQENRLYIAEKLLKETTLQIQEISNNVGYKDPSQFYKIFKKKYKISPYKFRSTFKHVSTSRNRPS